MITTLVMAAGNSSRLGRNKQLLPYQGKNLLGRCLYICRKAKASDLTLVLGSNYESIIQQVKTKDLTILLNPKWKNGLSSSIDAGIHWAKSTKKSGVIIVLPDQIHLSSDLLMEIAQTAQENPDKLICSKYRDGFGAPTYFPAKYFDQILEASTQNGFKSILKKHKRERIFVEFPNGMIDIDRPEDLALLKA